MGLWMRSPRQIKPKSLAVRPLAVLGLILTAVLSYAPMVLATAPLAVVSHPPSALSLYRLSLTADANYAYSGRKYLTEWLDDGRLYASVEDVSHLPPSSDLTTFIAPLSSKGRQVLQVGDQQWTYSPRTNLLVHKLVSLDSAPPEQSAAFRLLVSNYNLKVSSHSTTVAGRKAFEVSIKPRMLGRPYALLWIDPNTGVVLRREEYHSSGALASVSYFGAIKFRPKLPPSAFEPSRWRARNVRHVEESAGDDIPIPIGGVASALLGKASAPKSLGGFVLQNAAMLQIDRAQTLHLLYSDGLNQLSLYETLRHGRAATRLPSSWRVYLGPGCSGRVSHKYAYVLLTWDTPSMNCTLVSDMSPDSLIKVAQLTGLIPQPPAHR